MMMIKTDPPMAEPVIIARLVAGDIGEAEGCERTVGIKLVI